MKDRDATIRWTDWMEPEELAFIQQFVLASGSLKRVAQELDVSYPTVRLRLDRIIARIEVLTGVVKRPLFEKIAAAALAGGKLQPDTYDQLVAAHRGECPRAPGGDT